MICFDDVFGATPKITRRRRVLPKTLLTGPELPVASDVAVPWDIAYFIEFSKHKLSEHPAEFLTALVAALNDRTKLSALDSFPEWRNQSPIPLAAPWPE
jgi:hypothetical protein